MSPHYLLYAILAVGAAGLALALPQEGRRGRKLVRAGAVLGAAALAGVAILWAEWISPAFDGRTFFIIFGLLAVIATGRVVTHPKPVYSALYLILVVLSVTGLAILAAAEFLGIALVIVYAGAILVTYIFVIMLAQQREVAFYDRQAREPLAAAFLGFAMAAAAGHAYMMPDPTIGRGPPVPYAESGRAAVGFPSHGQGAALESEIGNSELAWPTAALQLDGDSAGNEAVTAGYQPLTTRDLQAISGPQGNVRAIGEIVMTDYVIALQISGVLLLVAMIGAVVLAQKQFEPEALTPHERRQSVEDQDPYRAGREAEPF
jgi:NADH-quinone oxidoreductase subunit J